MSLDMGFVIAVYFNETKGASRTVYGLSDSAMLIASKTLFAQRTGMSIQHDGLQDLSQGKQTFQRFFQQAAMTAKIQPEVARHAEIAPIGKPHAQGFKRG